MDQTLMLSENLKPIDRYFSMYYHQGGMALTIMNWGWFGILLACAVIFTGLTGWLFERRNIHISGESGWRLSSL